MKIKDIISEAKTVKVEPQKPRNFVAKNAINAGAGAHKDKKRADKQGDVKHKKQLAPMEDQVQEEPASRDLCTSGKPDSALGASQLASCKSQGYRSRDGGKSHKVGSERVKVRGKRIKGKKYGGPLPDWS
jgi:hypothetical protein